MVNFDGDAGELHLAVGVGSGLEIEMMKSAQAVGDVDFHGCVIDRFGVGA